MFYCKYTLENKEALILFNLSNLCAPFSELENIYIPSKISKINTVPGRFVSAFYIFDDYFLLSHIMKKPGV